MNHRPIAYNHPGAVTYEDSAETRSKDEESMNEADAAKRREHTTLEAEPGNRNWS